MLETAMKAADAAEAVIRRYYQGDELDIQIKADKTPVTVADVETEKAIKAVITKAYPHHGFYGEETGSENIDAEYLWLIDPIDGTKAYVREYPMFSTQIALMRRGELICGVSNAPFYNGGERAWAEKGRGAFLNGKRIQVSDINSLDQAAVSLGNTATLAGSDKWSNVGELITKIGRIRGYGDFLHYHLLASGKIDCVIESDLNILDIAALTVIVREAGGIMTELEGGKINLETRGILASNTALRSEFTAALD